MTAILGTILWCVAAWLFWIGITGGNDFHLMSAITVLGIGVLAFGQAEQAHLLGRIERQLKLARKDEAKRQEAEGAKPAVRYDIDDDRDDALGKLAREQG